MTHPTIADIPAALAPSAKAIIDGFTNLPHGKRDFASSLLTQAASKGKLSDKQTYWFDKLAKMAGEPKKPEQGIDTGATLEGVMALFATAGQHLKRPKIVLALSDGRQVRLSPASKNSSNPGFLYVRLDGEYAGKVSPDGTFMPYKTAPADAEALSDLLLALSADPAGVAKVHGQKTGNCCFCNTEITTAESLHAGYGPICADHFGLPWGDVA